MTRNTVRRSSVRRPLQALLLSASTLVLAHPASAAQMVFRTDPGIDVEPGKRISQARGLTQVRLDSGAMLSFVDAADYRINDDDSVDLYSGSVTVAGAGDAVTVIRMPDGVEGHVRGQGSAANFSVAADGSLRGHTLSGDVNVVRGANTRAFGAGEMWAYSGAGDVRRVVSNGAQATPGAQGAADQQVQIADMDEGGPLAVAENGLPVALGDTLAAAGASGDVVAAARRVEAATANPSIATFPTGDVALLVSYAARLQNAYGGPAFAGARADVIRAYLGYLAGGGSGANFLSAYGAFLGQYLDLLRAGAAPSSFAGASVADLNAFIAYTGRTSGFGGLSERNRELVEAYLAFLAGGGDADLFARSYTDLVEAYFAYLREGGNPLEFQNASQQTLAAYIGFLARSGLAEQLSAADRALLESYLANGGLAFAEQYRAALTAYYDYLAAGNLPSEYEALNETTLRAYLEALQSTGLLAEILGAQAGFYSALLAHLEAGGALDTFDALNANIFAGYAAQLDDYYGFLLLGGQPSAYTALTQEQIEDYVAALQAAGVSGAFLADLADFYTAYAAYLAGGGNPDIYAGLPVLNLPGFADALNAYADYLANGGLPSGYGAADLATLGQYLQALSRSGQLAELLGAHAALLNAYFAHLTAGGGIDRYAGLPVYAGYVSALEAYHAFLEAGGLPSAYGALTAAQVRDYLAALAAAGGLAAQLGDLADFYTPYYAFVSAGGSANEWSGLPVYAGYVAALNAYHAFLAGGGLPSAYTALTQAQIAAYLDALDAAGGFGAYSALAEFFNGYYDFLSGGGDPERYSGIPVYANYVAALNAYYAFLAGGGLPGAYTALTQAQIETYLEALDAAGGFGAYSSLASFFSGYYAFLSDGRDAEDYAGIPVYANWLAAVQAYYAYLAAGGLPSAYSALTQAQFLQYLAALNGAGVLESALDDEELEFVLDYYAYLEGGADPDEFAGLPVNDPGVVLASGANVWIVTPDGPRVGTVDAAEIAASGQITAITSRSTGGTPIPYDFTGSQYGLKEHGRAGERVAWTRYTSGPAGTVTNGNYHLLVGTPAVGLPASGTVDYKLIGGTAPTDLRGPAGESGAFTGNLAVAFGAAPKVGFDFNVYSGTRGWHVETAGGAAGAASGGVGVDGDMRFQVNRTPTAIEGDACTAYCTATILGGLFGAGATEAGLQYVIDDNTAGRRYVTGVAVFGTTGVELDMIGTMPTLPEPEPEPEPEFNSVTAPVSLAYAGGFNSATAGVNFVTTLTLGTGAMVAGSETGGTATAYALDGDGGLTSYSAGATRTSGSTTIVEVSGNADTLIGRWTDGVNTGANPFTLSENQGFHYMLARPVESGFALPTLGVVHYDLLAATRPTYVDGSAPPGGITADMALVLGTTPKVAFEAEITMPGLVGETNPVFRYTTPGGVADPTQTDVALTTYSGGRFQFRVNGATGTDCNTAACWFDAKGAFAGDIEQLGLTYTAYNDLGDAKAVIGAAIFGNGVHEGGEPTVHPVTGNLVNSYVLTDMFLSEAGRNETMDLDSTGGNFGHVAYRTDADGELVEIKQEFGWALGDAIGTASNADTGRSDSGAVRWTRWTDGTIAHTRAGAIPPIAFTANQGYHFIVGTPATDVPATGRVDYELVGGTKPTSVAGIGAPGELTSGAAAVEFGATPKLGIELAFTQNGLDYALQTNGGVADVSASELSLAADTYFRTIPSYGQGVTVDGVLCGTCRPIWEGFLAGPQGGELALSYTMQRQNGDRIIGTAGFAAVEGGGNDDLTETRANQLYFSYYEGVRAGGWGGSTVTLANGEVTRIESPVGTLSTSGGTIHEAGAVDSMAWARWAGGSVDVASSIFGNSSTPIDENAGYHVLAGAAPTALPAGRIDYELIGSTAATDNRGSAPGTVTGDLAIQFGSVSRVAFAMEMKVGGMGWAVATTGGIADPTQSEITLGTSAGAGTFDGTFPLATGNITASGGACSTNCSVTIQGSLYGANADYAGIAMHAQDVNVEDGNVMATGLALFSAEAGAYTYNPYANAPGGTTAAADWSRFEGADIAGTAAGIVQSPGAPTAADASALFGGNITFAGQ